jgi:hypothetical protein
MFPLSQRCACRLLRESESHDGHDHRFSQLENLDCASQAPLHSGYTGYAGHL